jgi:HK97 family phage prohead protease
MPKEKRLTHRYYPVELRTEQEFNGVIEGMPIVFNQETVIHDWGGNFREIIDPHALDNVDLRDVMLFVNHDDSKLPLARSRKGRSDSTMTCEVVKDEGLKITATLDVANNSDARNLYSAIKRGDIDGMSFAFRVDGDKWSDLDSELPTRLITSISIVHEVSCVNYPAYSQTTIAARSQSEDESVLVEAKRAAAEETVKRSQELCEMIKIKTRCRLKLQ